MTSDYRPRPLVAQAAEADELRELLAVVLEAIEIPHAATVGGGEARGNVLTDRAIAAAVTLRAVVEGLPHYTTVRDQTRHLREALAAHPVRGYVTWETAMARREAGQGYMQSVTPQTPEEGAVPAESELQACGCGGEGCATCRGTYVMLPAGQTVSDGRDDEHQEHADEAPRDQI